MVYRLDLRKRVVEYIENGKSITQTAALFQVGIVVRSRARILKPETRFL
jgi:transposase